MAQTKDAVFAGGCFWCLESPFDKVPGVMETVVGYTGGHVPNPSYEDVSSGTSGHVEAIRVVYDPATVSYRELLRVFWRNIDPLDAGGQFCDRGGQYRSVIFVGDKEEENIARSSLLEVQTLLSRPVVTEVAPRAHFYPAEEYHQEYYKKNPVRYHFYRQSCGRDRRLKHVWRSEAK